MILSALFREGRGVHDAVKKLLAAGYDRERVLVLLPHEMAESPLTFLQDEQTMQENTRLGGIVGGLLGGIATLGALALAGPFGALAISAAGAGALSGSVLGLLVGSGFSDGLAEKWMAKVHEGHAIVGVRGVEGEPEKARVAEILAETGGSHVGVNLSSGPWE